MGRGGYQSGKGRGQNRQGGERNKGRPRSWNHGDDPGAGRGQWVGSASPSGHHVSTPPGQSPGVAGSPLGPPDVRPSRGNSPWHLPSPMSPLSTTSSDHRKHRDRFRPRALTTASTG